MHHVFWEIPLRELVLVALAPVDAAGNGTLYPPLLGGIMLFPWRAIALMLARAHEKESSNGCFQVEKFFLRNGGGSKT